MPSGCSGSPEARAARQFRAWQRHSPRCHWRAAIGALPLDSVRNPAVSSAAYMYKYVLLAHILGATIWTGGHLVLAIAVLPQVLRERSPAALRAFESAYEKIGMPALAVQVATGLWLAYQLVPDVRAWFKTDDYLNRLILFKLALLGATVLVAADARLRIIPRLSPATLPAMARRIVAVTALSVLFVATGVTFRVGPLF